MSEIGNIKKLENVISGMITEPADFDGLQATKIGFIRTHRIIKKKLNEMQLPGVTDEILFELLKEAHGNIFGVEFPVKSWDSLRRFRKDHIKESYK